MRSSRFNIYYNSGPNRYLVYNTMNDAIIRIDDELENCMRNNSFEDVNEEYLSMLMQNGFVTSIDETSIFQLNINRLKYSGSLASFILIPTHRCNLNCTYCYQQSGTILTDTMDESTVLKVIKYIKRMAAKKTGITISLYGGEPLLEPDILLTIFKELKKYCDTEKKSLKITGATNGTLLSENLMEKFKIYHVNDIQITFAGPKSVHDVKRAYKNGSGTYDRLIEVIRNLEKHKIDYRLRIDVDKENFSHIGELLDDLKDKLGKAPRISIQKVSCITVFNKHCDKQVAEVSEERMHELYSLAILKGYSTNTIALANSRIGCGAIFDDTYTIAPNGDIYKCCSSVGIPEHRLGTIAEDGTLKDVNQEAYCKWALRNPLQFDECRSCEFAPMCFAGCAFHAYNKFGDINVPICNKEQYQDNIKTYLKDHYLNKWG
ncbi:MAG: pyrroloquinoline quinone biosynthesis protein PqqE [Methanosaeta sp. PtaB.Bin039]|nr:MAG: pyrroloquinoline quinone biosynthesis protein PqqE [Methanosaeta sp. PtaB.Bin039]